MTQHGLHRIFALPAHGFDLPIIFCKVANPAYRTACRVAGPTVPCGRSGMLRNKIIAEPEKPLLKKPVEPWEFALYGY